MADIVRAIGPWNNNAEMIADVAKLGYLNEEWLTLDSTYGEGNFWTIFRPKMLVGCDLDAAKSPVSRSVDFRNLYKEFAGVQFKATVLDPPYMLNGTDRSQGPATKNAAYGVAGRYVPWRARHEMIELGIVQSLLCTEKRGYFLLKCMDQVSSGHVRWQTFDFKAVAEATGMARLVDLFDLKGESKQPGDDGPDKVQKHARRNYSTLMVFKRR